MPIATATDDRNTVVVSDKGQKGDTGTAGLDGQGFNGIRQSLLDSPLCRLFAPNKLVDTLAGSLTATRASTATYVDRYGVVKTAAIDEMREESEGWLIEGASTNLLTYSQDFSDASWLQNPMYTSSWIKTDNSTDINAPDGTQTATKLDSATVDNLFARKGALSLTSGATYTASLWVYVPTQAGVNNFSILNNYNDSDDITTEVITQFDKWVRLSTVSTLTANRTNLDYEILVNSTFPEAGFTFYIWGAQLEQLPFATSYIPTTTAAATRVADEISAQPEQNLPETSNEFTFYTNTDVLGRTQDDGLGKVQAAFSSDALVYFAHNGFISGSASNCTVIGTENQLIYTSQDSQQVAITSEAGSQTLYDAGIQKVTSSVASASTDRTRLAFGSGGGGDNPLYGHLRDFRIYDFALNADEAAYLSGVK